MMISSAAEAVMERVTTNTKDAIIAIVIMSGPLRATNEASIGKKSFTFAVGLAYLILVIVGYFQLVPKVSSY